MYEKLSPILYILAVLAFCAGFWNCYVTRLLWKEKHCSSTLAKLVDSRIRQNVKVRSGRYSHTVSPYEATGTYVCTINGKERRFKVTRYDAYGKLPGQPRVIYLTRFPRHAYLREFMNISEIHRAMLWLIYAVLLWLFADLFGPGGLI